nr:hypothetical protein [uncultured Campylobacter sp.]
MGENLSRDDSESLVKISKFYRLCARNSAWNFGDAMRTVYLGILPQNYHGKIAARRISWIERTEFWQRNFKI